MPRYTKIKHIELSVGDTVIVSNDNCPLTESEAIELDILFPQEAKLIPCCMCDAFNGATTYDIVCPYYNGYILSDTHGESFNCLKINKI